eukprot:5634606-Heterocapsa_arctica.AAC.1
MIDVGKPLAIDHSSTMGWGIWVKEGRPLNSFGVVPGVEQTARRAELYAAVKALERTSKDVFLIIDSKAC